MNNEQRFAAIKLLISDVDGVLTKGDVVITESGEEIKTFNIHDGFGIKLLQQQGIPFAIISSRSSNSVLVRMKKLGVRYVYQGYEDKLRAFDALLAELNLLPEQVAYVGDDWPDAPVLQRVGLAIAVPNAVIEIKNQAHYVTECPGGKGAIREVIMKILKAQGLYVFN